MQVLFQSRLCLYGMTTDHNGILYFSQQDNLWKFDPTKDANPVHLVHDPGSSFCEIVVDGYNIIYIANETKNAIMQFCIDTHKLIVFAGPTKGHKTSVLDVVFCRPTGVKMDSNGDLYVVEEQKIRKIYVKQKRVEIIAEFSNTTPLYEGLANECTLYAPCSLALGSDGTIFVVSSNCLRTIKNNCVRIIAGNPFLHGEVNGNLKDSLFDTPIEIHWIRQDKKLLLLDVCSVRFVDLEKNTVSSPQSLQFEQPRAATVDRHGNIFISDNDPKFVSNRMFFIESVWKRIRFLWIGLLKEDASYCYLAMLPKEIIREIASFV